MPGDVIAPTGDVSVPDASVPDAIAPVDAAPPAPPPAPVVTVKKQRIPVPHPCAAGLTHKARSLCRRADPQSPEQGINCASLVSRFARLCPAGS